MHGKKVRIFYHGMMKQCNGCFGLGHMKYECKNEKKNWREYLETMRKSGNYTDQMFGSWIENKPEATTQNQVPDLRQFLNNPAEMRKMFEAMLSGTAGPSRPNQQNQQNRGERKRDGYNQNQRGGKWKRGRN